MFCLVMGGAASGKSVFAEELLSECKNKVYLATMQSYGEAAQERIARHRLMRAGKRFETVERYTDLKGMDLQAEGILIECMTNLLANELYATTGAGEKANSAILSGVDLLKHNSRSLVVVTANVFADGVSYDLETQRYQRMLAEINIELAKRAEFVYEVVCGIPLRIKGGIY